MKRNYKNDLFNYFITSNTEQENKYKKFQQNIYNCWGDISRRIEIDWNYEDGNECMIPENYEEQFKFLIHLKKSK